MNLWKVLFLHQYFILSVIYPKLAYHRSLKKVYFLYMMQPLRSFHYYSPSYAAKRKILRNNTKFYCCAVYIFEDLLEINSLNCDELVSRLAYTWPKPKT